MQYLEAGAALGRRLHARYTQLPRKIRRVLLCVVAIAFVLVLLRVLPKPELSSLAPSSRSVLAANGELLRLTLADDQQYRLWTPLEEISPALQQAAILYEDRWFYWHPGVNPWALLRAAMATSTGSRRIGGSTLSMQLARRVYNIDSRSLSGKLRQSLGALWLELRYSKHDILEAYLNYAPFGGNIEGVGAASLIYMRKPARQLTLPEALNLAVIPQNPRKRLNKDAGPSPALVEARNRLAQHWRTRFPGDAAMTTELALNISFKSRSTLPFRAPHLVDTVLQQTRQRVITTSLNPAMQTVVERVLKDYVKSRQQIGINNATAMLVDTSTMQVKAVVGSADYANESIAGQVNGTLAKRSPGSTLKPFIYALALDQGLIHSATILRDGPRSYGAFSPENFDGRFSGPLSATDALIRSRNLPAVDLATRLSHPNLYALLKMAGVSNLNSESHYGLALVLGGAEVTSEELIQLYAMLANGGQWQPLTYLAPRKLGKPDKPLPLIGEAASFITLDMLKHTPRPDTYGPARPAIAWKTGTSWGFRDAWTAGVFGRHALVVWVGNFDGSSNPALVGIDVAAPLFLRIVDALRAERLDPGELTHVPPKDLQRIEVCTASGDLPNAECPARSQAWFIAGKSPIRTSTLHRKVLVDTRTGKLACKPGPHTREEVFEYWPSDMQTIFRRAGLPLRQPPSGSCEGQTQQNDEGPTIVVPLRGVVHLLRINQQEPLLLRAEAVASDKPLRWFVDATALGSSKPGETLTWLPPQAGKYTLRVVDAEGHADSRELIVELAP